MPCAELSACACRETPTCGRCGDLKYRSAARTSARLRNTAEIMSSSSPGAPGRVTTVRRARRGQRAIRNQHCKIPIPWLERAASLPGRSLHAGIAVWTIVNVTGCATVPLSNLGSLQFGLDRNAKYRALAWLEGAGLVRVERKLGRAPMVTILVQEPPQ